jgi:hypothetical protein
MVLNNLLVSLVYELLRKYFFCDESKHMYFIAHAYWPDTYICYINIDGGGVIYKHIYALFVI